MSLSIDYLAIDNDDMIGISWRDDHQLVTAAAAGAVMMITDYTNIITLM